MTTKTLRWLFISLLLVTFMGILGTKGWKKTGQGSSSSGGIAGLAKTCRYIENPADGEDFEALFGHFFAETTVISMWCRTEGGTDVDLRVYEDVDGSKTKFTTGTNFTCDNNSEAGRTDNFTDEIIQAGNEIGVIINDVDGAVSTVNICIEFE